jgi:glycine cleavage system H protein
MDFPDDRRYAATHEWAQREGDLVRVGISDFAQDQLGDIVYVELPDPGTAVSQGQRFGVVESVKAAADLYAPVSGEVVEANGALSKDLDVISREPYGQGWMLVVRPRDLAELDALLDSAAYQKHCEEAES